MIEWRSALVLYTDDDVAYEQLLHMPGGELTDCMMHKTA